MATVFAPNQGPVLPLPLSDAAAAGPRPQLKRGRRPGRAPRHHRRDPGHGGHQAAARHRRAADRAAPDLRRARHALPRGASCAAIPKCPLCGEHPTITDLSIHREAAADGVRGRRRQRARGAGGPGESGLAAGPQLAARRARRRRQLAWRRRTWSVWQTSREVEERGRARLTAAVDADAVLVVAHPLVDRERGRGWPAHVHDVHLPGRSSRIGSETLARILSPDRCGAAVARSCGEAAVIRFPVQVMHGDSSASASPTGEAISSGAATSESGILMRGLQRAA